MKNLLLFCSLTAALCFAQTNESKQDKDLYFKTQFRTLGTYCWIADKILDKFDFAQKNDVTEIYLMQNEPNFPYTAHIRIKQKIL